MAYNDGSGVRHAQNMLGINAGVRNLRIVGVYAPQNDPKPSIAEQVPHPLVEQARPGAEIVIRQDLALGLVRLRQHGLDLLDLALQLVVAQPL